MNADNAMSNNTQSEAFADMANSFVLEHCVCCFNHTLQLSAKTLLHPFNAGLGKTPEDANTNDVDDFLNLESDDGDGEDDDEDKDKDSLEDDADDGIDELDQLGEDKYDKVMANTAAVHEVVTKLCCRAFAIVWSTTIALSAWCHYFKELKLKSYILPHDIITHWNSMYYILHFMVKYHTIIDAMTADKSLKLQKFKLEMEEWSIAEDLVAVLL